MLRKLLNEKLVEVVGVTHSGWVLSRTYRPTEKSKQAIMDYFVGLYRSFKDVVNQDEICNQKLMEVLQLFNQSQTECISMILKQIYELL